MIKKIRIFMEYNTFPIWLYNEKDEIIDNDLPPDWHDTNDLEKTFMALSDFYDALFLDTATDFRYIGFQSPEDKQKFISMAKTAVRMLTERNNGQYTIIDDTLRNI